MFLDAERLPDSAEAANLKPGNWESCDKIHGLFYSWNIYLCSSFLPFSAANLALAGFPLTNPLGESMPSRH